MRVLLIGATGFIGSYVAKRFHLEGHDVTVLHRGASTAVLPESVAHIFADRNDLTPHLSQLRKLAPEVVVDVILSSGRQANALMDVFRGYARRVVALSSADVYRARGVLHGTEPGALQDLPLTEDSDLRTNLDVYRKENLRDLKKVFSWLDDEYDKIPVERAILGDPDLEGVVLRLPMTYGPGDPLHRLFPYLKRMDDGRPAIFLQEDAAAWRGPRGFVENVAAAIVLAALSGKAAGRVYNVAEPEAFTEIDWVRMIARAVGWNGSIIALPKDEMPAHLRTSHNSAQHWVVASERIRAELGFFEPVAAEDALAQTIAWERANPPAQIDPPRFDYEGEDRAIPGTK
jgi:nucleoside-diphosphate-sugar epimerase